MESLLSLWPWIWKCYSQDTLKVSNKSGLKRGGLEQTAANACKDDQAPDLT